MKKILFINTVFSGGGAAKIARQLFEYMNKNLEMEAYFAYGRGKKVLQKNTFRFGFWLETFIHIFLVRILGIDGWGSYFSTKRLIDYIKKNDFNLVHLHNVHGYYLNYRQLFKFFKENNIPVVWTLHDEWILTWLPAHSLGCNHCLSGVGKCVNEYEYPKTYSKLFAGWLLKKKKKLVTGLLNLTLVSPAEWLVDKVKKSYPLLNVRHIANGINSEMFAQQDKTNLRKKYGLPLNKKIVLFSAANLNDTNKNINFIIKAAKEMEEDPYFFVGLGVVDYKSGTSVKFLGYIEDERVLAEIYLLSDIFCFLSKAETAPLSLLEAQVAGLFIVASNLEANEEILKKYQPKIMLNKEQINNLSEFIKSVKILSLQDSTEIVSVVGMSKKYLEVYLSNL